MMINCKEAARRSSELRDHPMRGMRRFELWFHLIICKFCKIYHKQIQMLGKLARLMGREASDLSDPLESMTDAKLSEDAKARIKRSMTAT